MFSKFRLEMQPYHRPMSYDSLKSIVPHMELPKRLQLSFLSPLVHGINRRVPFSLSFLKFRQTYSNPDCTTGVLFVESVEYSFESIDACHVEIRCLGRRRVSREKDVARRYFEYFLRTSVLPVRQLELIHCNTQFHNFHDIPIPRLKLHKHPDSNSTLLGFPAGHRMDHVELIDARIQDLNFQYSRAHHLKFSAKWEKQDDPRGDAALIIAFFFFFRDVDGKVECRIKMDRFESLATASMILRKPRIKVGSYVIGVFDKDLDAGIREKLLTRVRVEEVGNNYIHADFGDYPINTDSDQDCITFTSILLPKKTKLSDYLLEAGPHIVFYLLSLILVYFFAHFLKLKYRQYFYS